MVEDWNRYGGKKSESASTQHNSDIEDWLLCTLPPSFALEQPYLSSHHYRNCPSEGGGNSGSIS